MQFINVKRAGYKENDNDKLKMIFFCELDRSRNFRNVVKLINIIIGR